MLKASPPPADGAVPCISALCENVLVELAEVLLANNKYRYAILCFEGAITSHKLRKRNEFFELNRRIAQVTHTSHIFLDHHYIGHNYLGHNYIGHRTRNPHEA